LPKLSLITAFKSPVMKTAKWQRCTEAIARMCAWDLIRQTSIVEGEGFKAFCKELNPSFNTPGENNSGKIPVADV